MEKASKEMSLLNNISDDNDSKINTNTNESISNINSGNSDNDSVSSVSNENRDNDNIYNIILRILAVGFIFDYFHTIDIINLLISSKVLLNFRGMIEIYKTTFK